MNRILLLTLILVFSGASCGVLKKSSVEDIPSVPEIMQEEPVMTEFAPPIGDSGPIREVEEKLVPVDDKPVDPHRYFVIIGSFRHLDNARQHQSDILADGFRSELMRNEQGLYRVSVMATNDVSAARTEIMRVRTRYSKYDDIWLLISRK